MKHDVEYFKLLRHVLIDGRFKEDRTGTGTTSVFGYQSRYPLATHFPLLTTKSIHLPSVIHELLWFLKGDTNIKYLNNNGVRIWNEWADENGDLGPVYGSQWRSWQGLGTVEENGTSNPYRPQVVVDQITNVFNSLRDNPFSRRHIVSAWNPCEVDNMALPPCHTMFQFYVERMTERERLVELNRMIVAGVPVNFPEGYVPEEHTSSENADARGVPTLRLSCHLYQRSADSFLGIPFNIASYSLLTHMFAQQLGYAVGDFVHSFGDLHIYSNHEAQVTEQLSRVPRESPILRLHKAPSLFDYKFEDFEFLGYSPDPAIRAKVAV